MRILVASLALLGCFTLPTLAIGQDAADLPKAENPRPNPLPYHSETILCRLKNAEEWVDAWQQVRGLRSDSAEYQPLDRGGHGYPYLNVLDALANRHDIIAPIVAKVLDQKAEQIGVMRRGQSPPKKETIVSVLFESAREGGNGALGGHARIDRLTMNIEIEGNVSHAQVEKIAKSIAEEIVVKLPAASELWFDEVFDSKLQNAEENYAKIHDVVSMANKRRLALQAEHALSGPQIDEQIADVQKQLLATQLEQASLEARNHAIELQIAKEAERLKNESRSDEMVDVLKQLVKLREAEVEHLKAANRKVAGSVDQREIDKATANVLEARIQLLQAQGKQRTGPDQEMTESLRKELIKVVVDRADVEAKIKLLENRSHELPAMRAKLREDEQRVQLLATESAYDTKQLEFARRELSELQAIERSFKPLKLIIPSDEVKH